MGVEKAGNAENVIGVQIIFMYLLSKVLPRGRPFARLWELPVEGKKASPCL